MKKGLLRAERDPLLIKAARLAAFVVLGLIFSPEVLLAAANLSDSTGKVFFRKSGSAAWEATLKGQVLNSGDRIRTEAGGRATVTFEDGSRVEIGPRGSFAIQETTKESSSMLLGLGTLKAWVTKGLNRQFKVRTPTAVCSVRGTEFGVDVSPQGNTAVQMFTGMLAVSDQSGNEVLIKDNQSISVTDKGLGPVQGANEQGKAEQGRESFKREVGLEMTKEEVQAAAAIEQKNAIYQQGKAIIDVNGNRVRIEEYIIRPQPDQFKLVVLNSRLDRFDYFYYKGTFNTTLPDDISIALRQLPGCIGAACPYFMTGYETARSNTKDNMLEIAGGGHQVDVNNNAAGLDANGNPVDAVRAAYDPASNSFVTIKVTDPSVNNPAINTPFFKTLFNTNRLTFNGTEHSSWASARAGGADIRTMKSAASGGDVTFTNTTTVQSAPSCGPPDCTYTEDGVLHQVVYASNATGTIWEKYDSYIISDEGKIAKTSDFSGITSGTQYKQTLLGWNFQTIVTASEFQGRKIDLAVEPKIFIQSGLIP